MARSRGLWAELQREQARRQRQRQQSLRVEAQAAARARREYQQAAARQATTAANERKRLYLEARKAEAASMTSDLQARVAELDSVLSAGVRQRPLVTFASLKRAPSYPPFDAGGLERPLPAPRWEQFAPPPPGRLGKLLGGRARCEHEETAARVALKPNSTGMLWRMPNAAVSWLDFARNTIRPPPPRSVPRRITTRAWTSSSGFPGS